MLYDLINAINSACLIFILMYIYKIPMSYYIIILGHLVTVFLTNDLLFPISYMPDQFRYIATAINIRDNVDFLNYYQYDRSNTVSTAALFFAAFPILFLNSVFSIAIINFMLFSLIFIFLYKKNILNNNKSIWFYLLYPSFALYAAIGSRDTLILVFMIFSVYLLYKNKLILSLIVALPLLLLKFQNFLIFLFAIFIYKFFNIKSIFSIKGLIMYTIIIGGLIGFMILIPIEAINIIRYNMYTEDGGDPNTYENIIGYGQLAITGLTGSIYILLKPLFWESKNILQLIQSFENIFIFIIIYKIFRQLKSVTNKFKYFLYNYLFISMAIYGIVVFNFGTAARYKYTFILIFVIFASKLIYDKRKRIKIGKN